MFNVSVLQLLFGSKPLVLHLVERQRILLLSAYFFGEEAKKKTLHLFWVFCLPYYLQISSGRDCFCLLNAGHNRSGVYSVDPDGRGHFSAYCDMHTDGGGWTVFQRRQDGSVDFYRNWSDYKVGFGQLTGEFWLGNDKIHRLTAALPKSLRVDLEDWNGVKAYAKYGKFDIGDEQLHYRLDGGSYSGTAGDSLAYHYNMAFSTKDSDNDNSFQNCAVISTGAWWYKSCHYSNLNGKYLGNKHSFNGIRWSQFRNQLSLKFAEMKLRPKL